jgi:hypothetical protein
MIYSTLPIEYEINKDYNILIWRPVHTKSLFNLGD